MTEKMVYLQEHTLSTSGACRGRWNEWFAIEFQEGCW